MGEHRTSGSTRGVAKGPLVVLVTIVVLVLAVVGWFQLKDRIADQGVEAADKCVEGSTVLPVTVDPDIAPVVTELGRMFDATAPVIRDHCVTVSVTAGDSAAVATGLNSEAQTWDAAALGPRPALWIPQSSNSVASLTDRAVVASTPKSVALSPVVLAVPNQLAVALGSATVAWQDLPRLQQEPGALGAVGLASWGSLRLRLPTGPNTESTSSALAAVTAAITGVTTTPLPDAVAADSAVVTALSDLAQTDRGTSVSGVATSQGALDELNADAFENSDFHALPVTEQQLLAEASTTLTAFYPAGASPVADHPAVVVSGNTVDETYGRAAAQFADFVRAPEHRSLFTDAGFRVDEAVPAVTDSVGVAAITSTLPPVGSAVATELNRVVANPVRPRRATVLLDVSGSMETSEGGRSRLQNTVASLTAQFDRAPDSTELGLWVFSRDLDGRKPYRIAVPTGPLTQVLPGGVRRQSLDAAAAALTPQTATSTYASAVVAYSDAVDGYIPGRPNSVVLITDGPNDDTTVSPTMFATLLAALADPDRPVALEVVSIGADQDEKTLRAAAESTGGEYVHITSSADESLPDTLGKLLY